MNPKLVKLGIPGLTGAFTLSAGVTCWWCRDPYAAAMILMVLVFAAVISTSFATGVAGE